MIESMRKRIWDAAASENNVTYWYTNDDIAVINDPSIMLKGNAIMLDVKEVGVEDFCHD